MLSLVYGSVGCLSVGAMVRATSDARGDGVEVTLLTNPPSVEPIPPTTPPRPRAPTNTIPTPSTTTAASSPSRAIIGRPRSRLIGRWPDRRAGPGERVLTLTGAGRPVDGGRGRTWVWRWSLRVVIARIVARVRSNRFTVRPGPDRLLAFVAPGGAVRCTLARSRA